MEVHPRCQTPRLPRSSTRAQCLMHQAQTCGGTQASPSPSQTPANRPSDSWCPLTASCRLPSQTHSSHSQWTTRFSRHIKASQACTRHHPGSPFARLHRSRLPRTCCIDQRWLAIGDQQETSYIRADLSDHKSRRFPAGTPVHRSLDCRVDRRKDYRDALGTVPDTLASVHTTRTHLHKVSTQSQALGNSLVLAE